MRGFEALERELGRWSDDGRTATFWWRDDDAVSATPALERLLALGSDVAVHLAVVPVPADATLAGVLRDRPSVVLLQHGYAHANHAPAGEKRAEFGAGRPPARAAAEIERGRRLLARLLARRAPDVFVPPWNRIDDALLSTLAASGFRGLSTFGPRATSRPVPGLGQVNTHVDIVDWKGTRGFVGANTAITDAVAHLSARRSGAADPDEPTGLLTHHLDHDEACWGFVEELLGRVRDHPGARWLGDGEVF